MTKAIKLTDVPSITGVEQLPFSFKQVNLNDEILHLVDARDLHDFLEIKTKFSMWIERRIKKYQFIENEDFFCFPKVGSKEKGGHKTIENEDFFCYPNLGSKGKGGHNAILYAITMDMAKELAMVENNKQGRQARRYFIRCEKELKKRMDAAHLKDIMATIMLHTQSTQELLEVARPQMEFYETVMAKPDTISMAEAAQVLGFRKVSGQRLYQYLRACNILKKCGKDRNLPLQAYLEGGYFEVAFSNSPERTGWTTTRVRPKGLEFIRQKLIEGGFQPIV